MGKKCPRCLMMIPQEAAICPCCKKRFNSLINMAVIATFLEKNVTFCFFLLAVVIALWAGYLYGKFLGWIVFIGLCCLIFKNKTDKQTITVYKKTGDEKELRHRAEIDQIRKEIREAINNHAAAVKVFMALCRIDGTTSEAERRVVFAFLNRHGTALTEERHWPFFHGHTVGEWQQAATPDEIDRLCEPLEAIPQSYRLTVAAAAQAIVASGGRPKKSEQIALEIVQRII